MPHSLRWVQRVPHSPHGHAQRLGGYRVAAADASSRISYPDYAIAVVDEIERPKHREIHIGLEGDSGIMDR